MSGIKHGAPLRLSLRRLLARRCPMLNRAVRNRTESVSIRGWSGKEPPVFIGNERSGLTAPQLLYPFHVTWLIRRGAADDEAS
jgi:hypothetical protein